MKRKSAYKAALEKVTAKYNKCKEEYSEYRGYVARETRRIKTEKETLRKVLNSKGFNIPQELTLGQWADLIAECEGGK